jgi:nitrous oxidase accessory protein NosD
MQGTTYRTLPKRYFASLLLAGATTLLPAAAAGQATAEVATPPRQIHGPTVIDRAGVYVLARNFRSKGTGVAIAVRASNVTLDLGGRTVSGPGSKQGTGISVEGATNVRIAGGSLRGFGIGIQVIDATNVRVADVQIDGQDLGGTPPDVEVGILILDSRGVVVEDTLVSDTFLGIFVRGEGSGANRIAGNTLAGGGNGELGICYNPAPDSSTGGPAGDLVYGNHVSHFNRGIALSADSVANVVRGNSIASRGAAIEEATAGSNVIADNATVVLP